MSGITNGIWDHERHVAEAREVADGQTVITIDGPAGNRARYAVRDDVTIEMLEIQSFQTLPPEPCVLPAAIIIKGRPIRHPGWYSKRYAFGHTPVAGRDYPPLPTSAEVWAQGFEAGLNWTGGDPADVQNPYTPDPSSS